MPEGADQQVVIINASLAMHCVKYGIPDTYSLANGVEDFQSGAKTLTLTPYVDLRAACARTHRRNPIGAVGVACVTGENDGYAVWLAGLHVGDAPEGYFRMDGGEDPELQRAVTWVLVDQVVQLVWEMGWGRAATREPVHRAAREELLRQTPWRISRQGLLALPPRRRGRSVERCSQHYATGGEAGREVLAGLRLPPRGGGRSRGLHCLGEAVKVLAGHIAATNAVERCSQACIAATEARVERCSQACICQPRRRPVEACIAATEERPVERCSQACIAATEERPVERCSQACMALIQEAVELSPQLTALRGAHPFTKQSMRSLEAQCFPALVYSLPKLALEECDLNELLARKEATVEDWRVRVHLLRAQVTEYQAFIKERVPSFPITDVMQDSFFKKRKRLRFADADDDDMRGAGGGMEAPSPCGRRPQGTVGSAWRSLQDHQQGLAGKGFIRVVCDAPEGELEELMDFLDQAKMIAAEFSSHHFSEFYEHLAVNGAEAEVNEERAECGTNATHAAMAECPGPNGKGGGLSPTVAAPPGELGELDSSGQAPASELSDSVIELEEASVLETEVPVATNVVTELSPEEPTSEARWPEWPSEDIEVDEPFQVPNYVGLEHSEVMQGEIEREHEARQIFLASCRSPLGSELQPDEFTTVKEAYGMLRPSMWMVKFNMESTYRC
ncbi:hypothetical protein CYMTET_20768 [Cymbomonas tetramitiformis]|uniref:Uncharacterized protein n=1 Tax=Cymbomonas tetramitiformis TaxID=36881 RepID=A0AAE0G3I3_9CHLO|nr:hypothetical protein CYMTET_20768 [Cymbomonas tetramitiformis]